MDCWIKGLVRRNPGGRGRGASDCECKEGLEMGPEMATTVDMCRCENC